MNESRMHKVARQLASDAAVVRGQIDPESNELKDLVDIYNSMCETLKWLNAYLQKELGDGDISTPVRGPIPVNWQLIDIRSTILRHF